MWQLAYVHYLDMIRYDAVL